MFRKIGLALASVTLVLMIAANQADAMIYADTVLDAEVGTNQKTAPTDNPANALGEPDLFTISNQLAAYYDLGHLGTLTLGFPDSFGDVPGVDVVVWEVSAGAEWMDIQLEVDGGVQTISPIGPPSVVGTRGSDAQFRFEFDLADLVGVSPGTTWNQLTIVDKTTTSAWGGADIDAVMVLSATALVDIDIKPGSFPSSINLGKKGVTPVAIHTTDDFDATTVDPKTVELNGVAAVKWEIYDCDELENPDYIDPIATPDEPEMIGDGDLDLVVYFDTQELGGASPPDGLHVGDTEATLTGETTDGTPIEGTGDVNIVVTGKP